MGETRDPALGTWTVYEGDVAVAHGPPRYGLGETLLRAGRAVDDPLEFPITFRVHRIRDGHFESLQFEVHEQDGRLVPENIQSERLAVRGPEEGRHEVVNYDALEASKTDEYVDLNVKEG